MNQYGIIETSSMGQIIEQEEDMQDVSIDKGKSADFHETEGKESSFQKPFKTPMLSGNMHANATSDSLVKKYASVKHGSSTTTTKINAAGAHGYSTTSGNGRVGGLA